MGHYDWSVLVMWSHLLVGEMGASSALFKGKLLFFREKQQALDSSVSVSPEA